MRFRYTVGTRFENLDNVGVRGASVLVRDPDADLVARRRARDE
jgi:hypothetical protein